MATSDEIYASLNKIGSNVTRNNKFSLSILLPNLSELNQYNRETNEIISLYTQQTSIPSQNLDLSEVKYLDKIKYAITGKNIDSVNITFYDTKEQLIRNMFINWLNAITTNSKLSTLNYYPSDYKTEITTTIHSTNYKFKGCTPISVSDLVLDTTSENQLGSFSVGFKIEDLVI